MTADTTTFLSGLLNETANVCVIVAAVYIIPQIHKIKKEFSNFLLLKAAESTACTDKHVSIDKHFDKLDNLVDEHGRTIVSHGERIAKTEEHVKIKDTVG